MADNTILRDATYISTDNPNVEAKIEWYSWHNDGSNFKSTKYKAELYIRCIEGEISESGYWIFGIVGNPESQLPEMESQTFYARPGVIGGEWVKIGEAEGSKSYQNYLWGVFDVLVYAAFDNFKFTYSGEWILREEKSKTLITSIESGNIYVNSPITIKYFPLCSQAETKIEIMRFLSLQTEAIKEIDIGRQSAKEHSIEIILSEDELDKIYSSLTESESKFHIHVEATTYIDGHFYGSSLKSIDVSVPNTEQTRPTADITIEAVNDLEPPFDKVFMPGTTKARVCVSNLEAKYGAEVKSVWLRVNGETHNLKEDVAKDIELSGSGDTVAKICIVDTRGVSTTYERTIATVNYTSPRVLPPTGESDVVCARCDAEGNAVPDGSYIHIAARRSYCKAIQDGVQYNFCRLDVRYKASGGDYSEWETLYGGEEKDGELLPDDISSGALFGGNISPEKSYAVQIRAVDTLGNEHILTVNVPTDKVYMHRAASRRSLGIGKYAEENNVVDVAEDIDLIIRGRLRFPNDAWVSLGLSDSAYISEPDEEDKGYGRAGAGCFYRVSDGGHHVYAAFNCAAASGYNGTINKEPLLEEIRPTNTVFSHCIAYVGDVVVKVGTDGFIYVELEAESYRRCKWIDGYIDYWI